MEDTKDISIPQSMLDMLSEKGESAVSAFQQNLTAHITRKEKEAKAKRKGYRN